LRTTKVQIIQPPPPPPPPLFHKEKKLQPPWAILSHFIGYQENQWHLLEIVIHKKTSLPQNSHQQCKDTQRWNLLNVKRFNWRQNQFHPMYFFISPHSQLLLDMVFKSIWEMLFHKLHDMWKSKFRMLTCQTIANDWVVIYNENLNELRKLMVHTLEKTTSLWWYKQRPCIPWLLQVFKLKMNSSTFIPIRKIKRK